MPASQSDPRLAEFAAYSKTQSKLSIKTAKDYVADVTRFAQFLAPLRTEQATQSHVVQYISHCHDGGLKRGTIGRRLFAIRAFFQFLKRRGLRDDDPTEGVAIPQESTIEERVVLTREEVRRALNIAGDRHVLRYKAKCEVATVGTCLKMHRTIGAVTTNGLRAVVAAMVLALVACSPQVNHNSFPPGVVFITERVPVGGFHGFTAGMTREYRDGRLVATQRGLPIVAWASAGRSLLYSHFSRSASRVNGGRAVSFNPCKDPYNAPLVALSPNGKRGICIDRYDGSNDLVLFDADNPDATGRVIFRKTFDNPQPFAWMDDSRIAIMELQPHPCPFYEKYGYAPTNLAVIDLRGHVISEGRVWPGSWQARKA